MTNATVAETVSGTDGQKILVKYKDGEKNVVVPPDTPIVTFVVSMVRAPSNRSRPGYAGVMRDRMTRAISSRPSAAPSRLLIG